jgi:ATP-dependent DNA ligase
MKPFKPMLAGKLEGDPKLPCMVSNKLDGVRAIVIGGVLMSRTLKPIPNRWCRASRSSKAGEIRGTCEQTN